MPAASHARHAMVEHCEGRFTVGAGAETYGLGTADPMLVASSKSASTALPSDAQVLTYRCARPARTTDSVPTAVAEYRAAR